MDETLQKGMITELKCMEKFISMGYYISIPYGNSNKYDLILDYNNNLYRIQIKTAHWSKDTVEENVAFEIATCGSTTNCKTTTRHYYTKEDIDFFLTYFEGEFYLIPIEEAENKSAFRLRYEYPKNGQRKNIHIASDYLLEKQLK